MRRRRRAGQARTTRTGPRRDRSIRALARHLTGRTALDDSTAAQAERAALDQLLLRVAAGDRVAFRRLYEQTSAKLFAIALRIASTRSEAEDTLQEAYCTIWRRAESFDPRRGAASTWLGVVTRNTAIDRLRARGLPPAPIETAYGVVDPTALADERLVATGERDRLAACVAALRPVDAAHIRAAFFEGATYAELARRAGQPLATVKSRIRRALLALRACLR